MAGHHFISYAPSDCRQFATSLSADIENASPQLRTWIDHRDLRSDDWAAETDDALRTCRSLIFVLSKESSENASRCTREWRRAISYSKPITVVSVSTSAVCPFRLETRKRVEFTLNAKAGLEVLVSRLSGLDNHEGALQTLQELIEDAKRELDYASESQRSRITADLLDLEQQIEDTQNAARQPISVSSRVALAIQREQQPRPQAAEDVRIRFVNAPPLVAPRYFQDRFVETRIVSDWLRDPASSLITIAGRGGVGKTAFVCRLLKKLESGMLPDDLGDLRVAGIVYMNAAGSREITFSNLFSDLLLLQTEGRKELVKLGQNPQATVAMKVRALLQHFKSDPVVVLLDNFEDIVSSDSRRINDGEIAECLHTIIQSQSHSLKVIVTTRILPRDFGEVPPDRHTIVSLEDGLPSPFAERILKEMDSDGHVGLRDAPDDTLARIKLHTRGFPRALEAFYAILAADRDTSIEEILSWDPSARIVHALVGEAFSRLSEIDQRVMQALAVYGYPSSATALDYLLEPWIAFIDTAPSLKRLVNMHMARREGSAYYLHPIDREYALSRLDVSSGTQDFRPEAISKESLLRRAADYYKEIRRPQPKWHSLADIDPHIKEFWLRLETGNDNEAAGILSAIKSFSVRLGAFEQIRSMASALKSQASSYESRLAALKGTSEVAWRIGKISDAISAQEEVVQLNERRGDPAQIIQEKANLLIIRRGMGVTEELLHDLIEVASKVEQDYPWAKSDISAGYSNIGFCQRDLGYLSDALENLERARELVRGGDVDYFEGATHNVGTVYEELGRIGDATRFYEEALSLSEQSDNPIWKANHLSALASCFSLQGDQQRAIDYQSQAIQIRETVGDFKDRASDTKQLAMLFLQKRDFTSARNTIDKAYNLATELGNPMSAYQSSYAEILLCSDELPAAQVMIENALQWPFGEMWLRENLYALILVRRRMSGDAKAAFNRALAESDKWISKCERNPQAWSGKALALAGLAACGDQRATSVAVKAYREARRLFGGSGAIETRLRLFRELRKALPESRALTQIERAIAGDDESALAAPLSLESRGDPSEAKPEATEVKASSPLLPPKGVNNLWYHLNESSSVIVFVHGIFSDSRECWLSTTGEKTIYWPQLVTEDERLQHPSVFLGGFYTAVDAGKFGIADCARELLNGLTVPDSQLHRTPLEQQRIVFICHSTGGIVVRYMLTRNADKFKGKDIGLFLIASPSYGSKLADKLGGLASFYDNQLGLNLKWGNDVLKNLDDEFKELLDRKTIPRLVGIEACENHFIWHRKFLPDRQFVVDKESAGRYFTVRMLPNTDHFSTVKPTGPDHPAHKLLVEFWLRHYGPPFDKGLMNLLKTSREHMRLRNSPYTTPALVVALLHESGFASLVLNAVRSGSAKDLRDRFREHLEHEITAGASGTFADFDWFDRDDVRRAQQLAMEEQVSAITERILLKAVLLSSDSKAVDQIREFYADDFKKVMTEVNRRRKGTRVSLGM